VLDLQVQSQGPEYGENLVKTHGAFARLQVVDEPRADAGELSEFCLSQGELLAPSSHHRREYPFLRYPIG